MEDYFDEGEYILADSAYASSEVFVPAYWGRWASLRELWSQLRSKDEMESLIKWVVCHLQNILANIGDVSEDVFMDDETPETHNTSTDGNTHSTIQMRESILPF
ncbi:hypothetical protein PPACK8108_LOCUS16407, partial [Phakopsora pachyrhizi]